jgi:integrase
LKTIESAPKEPRREKTILTDEQVNKLLTHLSETDSQQACWLALAIYSGSRFAELLRFTTDVLDENHTAFGDLFMETTRKLKTKGRGKDGKQLYKYILKEKFLPYYRNWLSEREQILKKAEKESLSLFIRDDGEPASEGTARSWVARMEKYLGINLYPHSFRHYLTTELSKKNIPPALIKDLFGWSDLSMVTLYDDTSSKDKEWKELDNLK